MLTFPLNQNSWYNMNIYTDKQILQTAERAVGIKIKMPAPQSSRHDINMTACVKLRTG